jgi:DNA invertase Pin-like site-specific DNA recombinase
MDSKSEQTRRGLMRAVRLGRKLGPKPKVSDEAIRKVIHLGTAEAARKVGLSKTQYITRRRRIEEKEQS